MSYNNQRNAIQTKFQVDFSAAYPGVPIIFDNIKDATQAASFVILNILNGASMLRGLGATRLFRYAGVVSVDIFIPLKTGVKIADQYADTVDGIFRGQQFGGLLFRASSRNDLGMDDTYWRVNISIPFQRDELV